MARLVLLRHGETAWNVEGRLQGMSDTPLSSRGLAQAAEVAQMLAPLLPAGARVVSSPLRRAKQTAAPLADLLGVDVEIDDRLRERSYGVWEGLTLGERLARDPAELERWRRGGEPRIDGYENHAAVAARMGAALRDHGALGDAMLVGHGSALRVGVHHVLGRSFPDPVLGPIPNTAWTELVTGDDGSWTLVRHAVRERDGGDEDALNPVPSSSR